MSFPCALAVAVILAITAFVRVPAQETISYSLAREGRVSLALYDSSDVQIRTILSAQPQEAGDHAILWDGLDREGRPVASGGYKWKLLQTQGFQSEFLTALGTSFGATQWPGCHNGPAALAVDYRRGHVYMAAASVEGGPQVVKMTMDGQIIWSHRPYEGWGHSRDIAFSPTDPHIENKEYPEGVLYFPMSESGNLHVLDARDGSSVLDRHQVTSPSVMASYKPLRAAFMKIDLCGADGRAAKGWTPAPLAKYSRERGFGWDSIDGLTVSTDAAANSAERDGHTMASAGAAGKEGHRSFLIKFPEGMKYCEARIVVEGNASELEVYSDLKQGKPNLREPRIEKRGRYSVLAFETKANKGVLDITLGAKEGAKGVWSLRAVELMVPPDRFDAYGDKVMAAFTNANRIQRIRPQDWVALSDTVVPDLRDVAIDNSGKILALSGDKVVIVQESGDAHTILIEGLIDPRALSVDRISGDLFVAERAGSHQIKRFDATGRLRKTFGRKGGRLQGLYEAENFLDVADVAGDSKGGFFIVEAWVAPRRTAHFDAEGKLIAEWYGGQGFYTYASLDPERPDRVWFDSHFGWIVEAEMNWEMGQWKPRATYNFDGLAGGLFEGMEVRRGWTLRCRDGKRYLLYSRYPAVVQVDEANHRLVPIVKSDMNVPPFVETLCGKTKAGSFLWTDANRDGESQKDEFVFSQFTPHGKRWLIDNDFTYRCAYAPKHKGANYLVRTLAPQWRNGIPVYPNYDDCKDAELLTDNSLRMKNGKEEGYLSEPAAYYRDASGASYLAVHLTGDYYSARGDGDMGHGFNWPADIVDGVAIAKWDKEGRLMWKGSGLASERLSDIPGRLNWPNGIVGTAHGLVGVTDRIVWPLSLWSEDGLYAGGVFDRNDPNDARYAWFRVTHDDGWEAIKPVSNMGVLQYDMNANGVFTEKWNNQAIFIGCGWNNRPAYRVSGFDRMSRQEGTVRIAKPAKAAKAAGKGLSTEYFGNVSLGGVPVLNTVSGQVWFGTQGKSQLDKPWPDSPVTKKPFSLRMTGQLEARFSEPTRFSLYRGPGANSQFDKARLWVNGKLVIDAWDNAANGERKLRSTLVNLTAGGKVPIKLEYAVSAAERKPQLHLCWESIGQPIEHVPMGYLYLED